MAAETNNPGRWGSKPLTPYEDWINSQGLPIVRGHGITDLSKEKFGHWDRLGCEAYFIMLQGLEGFTGMHVVQIAAGGTTKRERHMYEQVVYVLEGNGVTTLEDPHGKTHQFEWQTGSLFAIPLNVPYRMFAAGSQVRYLAITTAPLVFDLFHNEEFIHNLPFNFRDRFDGEPDYWSRETRDDVAGNTLLGQFTRRGWETNFVPDARATLPDAVDPQKKSLRFIQYELAGNSLVVHESKYPVGCYMQGHFHSGGAILLILRSTGYSLMWNKELGDRPFENGHGDQVVRVDWQPGSVFSPPTGWFHQHFNTGNEDALQLAFRYGSYKFPFGVWDALGARSSDNEVGTMRPRREGGAIIEYANEDPQIGRMYNECISAKGIQPWAGKTKIGALR